MSRGWRFFGGRPRFGRETPARMGLRTFFSQDEQCSQSAEPGLSNLVTSALSDALHHFFAAELTQVVGSLANSVFGHDSALMASHTSGQLFSRKTVGLRGQCDERLGYCTEPRFLDIDSGQ